MTMTRTACPQDLPAILAIMNREILEGVAHFGTQPISLSELETEYQRTHETYPWVVAVTPQDEAIGYAKAGPWKPRGGYAWTTEIGVYVHHEHQGKGIGKAMYTLLFKLLKDRGFHSILAGIALPNAASVALHESFGMKQIGIMQRVGYKLGAWHDVGYWQYINWDSPQVSVRLA